MNVEVLSDAALSTANHLTCAYPLATSCRDGSVVCLYRVGREKHSYDGILVSQRSADLGQSWSEPVTVFDGRRLAPPRAALNGGLCLCGDDSLFAAFEAVEVTTPDTYMFSAEGFEKRRLLITARSRDAGRSWGPSVRVDESVLGCPLGPTSNPEALANGRLFLPGERDLEGGRLGICASFSDDWGSTLEPVQDLIADPAGSLSLCDARFAVFADGQVLAMLWAFRAEDEETVEVHRSVSDDHGLTWSAARPVGYLGQITAPLVIAGDTVLAISNYRWPPQGSRLWVSRDRGVTWPVEESVLMWDADQRRMLARPAPVQDRGANEGVWDALATFSFGTPDLTALPDGTVLLTYYAETDGLAQVRACRFRAET